MKILDSYEFWKQSGGLVLTGHTGTNVMDIQVKHYEQRKCFKTSQTFWDQM